MITKKYVSSVGDPGSKGLFNYLIKKIKQIEKILSNLPTGGGNFIPLTGTTTGNPVTGLIEVQPFSSTPNVYIEDENAVSGLWLDNGQVGFFETDKLTGYSSGIYAYDNNLQVECNNPISRGLVGQIDYTGNITDLDYTQKKYVDERITISKPYKTFTSKVNQLNPGEELGVVKFENNFNPVTTWQRLDIGLYRLNLSPDGEAVDPEKIYVAGSSENWIPFNSEFSGPAGQYQVITTGTAEVLLKVINISNTYTDLSDIPGFSGGEYLHLPEIREYY